MARSSELPKTSRCGTRRGKTIPYTICSLCVAVVFVVATTHRTAFMQLSKSDSLLHSTASAVQHARRLFEHGPSCFRDSDVLAVPAHQALSVAGSSSSSSSSGGNGSDSAVSTNSKLPWDALQQAMHTLNTAGVQLSGVQQMQLDKLRMQAELYDRGKLQQRHAVLHAELSQPHAAAGSSSLRRSSSFNNDNRSSSTTSSPVSRGILIVAGSRDQMSNALVSIITLQQVLKCTLPIEIVYYGLKEYDPLTAKAITVYNMTNGMGRVRLVDGMQKQVDLSYHYEGLGAGSASNITGFATKVHALAYVTSFQQVLLLDADSLPLLDPEQLFDSEPFVEAGNLFWPDFWGHLWMDGSFFTQLGQRVPWEGGAPFHSAESGQVLFDRLRHYDVLEWLFWLNSHSSVTYQHMHGDKDTYRLAFSLAGKLEEHRQVALQPRDAMAVVSPEGAMPYLQHQGMVQHTPDERPAFLHRTDKGKLFPHCSTKNVTSDCQVSYFTIPLTEGQAMLAMSQPNFTYTYRQVDTTTFEACRTKQRDAGLTVSADRPDDPQRCPELMEGLNIKPVPVVPVDAFGQAHRVLYASYVAFDRVRALLAKGQQLLAENELQRQQHGISLAAGAAGLSAE